MNSEAAGTEYQVTITDGGRVKLIESDGGKGVTVKRTIGEWTPGELAEVIARNVQPSDNSKAWEEAFKEIDEVALAFRTKRNIQHFILRRVAELFPKASEEGAIAHAEACPVKVAYSADPVEFFTPDTWERLEAYAKEYGTKGNG